MKPFDITVILPNKRSTQYNDCGLTSLFVYVLRACVSLSHSSVCKIVHPLVFSVMHFFWPRTPVRFGRSKCMWMRNKKKNSSLMFLVLIFIDSLFTECGCFLYLSVLKTYEDKKQDMFLKSEKWLSFEFTINSYLAFLHGNGNAACKRRAKNQASSQRGELTQKTFGMRTWLGALAYLTKEYIEMCFAELGCKQ